MAQKNSRRKVLKSAATLTAIGATGGVVGAAGNNDTSTVRSEGIADRASELAHEGDMKKLSELLDQYGIPNACNRTQAQYDRITRSADTYTLTYEDGEAKSTDDTLTVTPSDEWDKSSSEFGRSTYHVDESADLWETVINWDLGDGGDAGEGQFEDNKPNDGVQLSFSTDDWDHKSIAAEARPDWNPDPNCSCSKGSKVEHKQANGIGVVYDDPNNPYIEDLYVDTTGSASTQVYRQDDKREHTLYGGYKHTWSTVSVTGITFNMDSTPIGIGVGVDTYSWEVNVDHIVKSDDTVVVDRY